jgi:hypothetical protein
MDTYINFCVHLESNLLNNFTGEKFCDKCVYKIDADMGCITHPTHQTVKSSRCLNEREQITVELLGYAYVFLLHNCVGLFKL